MLNFEEMTGTARWVDIIVHSEGRLMAGIRRNFQDPKIRVLYLLQDNPEISQRELAKAAEVSVGGVRYILRARVDKDLVKLRNFGASADKRCYAHIPTAKGIARKAYLRRIFLAKK